MKIAITGGIGSGKSFVCQLLSQYGIEVYDCDKAAKRLMATDEGLKAALRKLVGEDVYVDGKLHKQVLAKYLLASDEHKRSVNDIVHPAVARDFEESDACWLESAILFDSGFVHRTHFDYVVCVIAPLEVRVGRVMERDGISKEKTQEWIAAQLPQEEVVEKSDFQIVNDGKQELAPQVELLLRQLGLCR